MSAQSLNGGSKPAVSPAARASKSCVSAMELMGSARELLIEHAGEEYRLRITRNGKLILTK